VKSNLANDLVHDVPEDVADRAPKSADGARLDFDEVYRRWFHEVSRWVRAFGGLEADVDDLSQEVFMVVRRKLPDFDGSNLAGWLYRISHNTVRQHRRRAWVRRFFPSPAGYLEQIVDDAPDPAQEAERKDAQRLLSLALSRLSDAQRTVFILYEIEGYSGEEIAQLEGAPVNTVYTRLHYARKEFAKQVAKLMGKNS
jgi:RNA polymerase sigma-70 factor, ECF subfamily